MNKRLVDPTSLSRKAVEFFFCLPVLGSNGSVEGCSASGEVADLVA